MNLTIPTLSLRSVLIIGLLMFLSAFIWMKYGENPSRKDQITLTLSLFGGIAFLLMVYDRKENQKRSILNDKHRLAFDDLKNQEDQFIGLLKEFKNNYPESLQLYNEMFDTFSSNDITPVSTNNLKIDLNKQNLVNEMLSFKVFQTVENFLTIATMTIPSTVIEWLTRMLQWFKSPILRNNFLKYKIYFSDDAVSFINTLIVQSEALQNEIDQGAKPDITLYRKFASKIIFTPRI